MKKPLLFILDEFNRAGDTSFVKMYSSLVSHRYHIIIIGRRGNLSNPTFFFRNATVIEVPGAVGHSILQKIMGAFSYIKNLHTVYRKYPVQVIHFSTTWSSFYALLHPYTWKIIRVITYYGALDLEIRSIRKQKISFAETLGLLIRYYIQKFCLISSHRIITLSQYALNQLSTHFSLSPKTSQKIYIIPGLETVKRLPKNKISSHQFTILNIGRAEPRKGIELLLNAFVILKQRKIKFKALVASPVSYYEWTNLLTIYEKLNLFDTVQFLHSASEIQKRRLYRQADIYIMPSLDLETFGVAIIESLSYGLPVIGTPIGAIPETLNKIDTRLVTKSVTPIALANSIEWFYRLSQRQKQALVNKSYDLITNEYNPIKWKKYLLSIYKQ